MREAVAAAVAFQRDLARQEDEESRAAIAAEGCEIAELDADELAAFAAAVQPIYAEARALYPEQILRLLPREM
jgi:TRAP-type C4-dicarboxylate transport system substrate-binding protein